MPRRRIKAVVLRQYQLLVEMHYLDLDMFEITVADEIAVIRTCVIYADSFRHSRMAFTQWIHSNYPESKNEKPKEVVAIQA